MLWGTGDLQELDTALEGGFWKAERSFLAWIIVLKLCWVIIGMFSFFFFRVWIDGLIDSMGSVFLESG